MLSPTTPRNTGHDGWVEDQRRAVGGCLMVERFEARSATKQTASVKHTQGAVEQTKTSSESQSIESWLDYRDPYNGLL